MGTVRRVCRNVKRWRSASMAMRCDRSRYAGSGQRLPTTKGASNFQRSVALWKPTGTKTHNHTALLPAKPTPLNINFGSDRFTMFNKKRDIPGFGKVLLGSVSERIIGKVKCAVLVVKA